MIVFSSESDRLSISASNSMIFRVLAESGGKSEFGATDFLRDFRIMSTQSMQLSSTSALFVEFNL